MENELATQLRNLMRRNIVEFTFKKKDGTIRHARGTRNLEIASVALGYAVRVPKGEEQPNSYYDLDKDGWRSYIPSNLISIDRIVPMPTFGEMVREVYGNEKPRNEERREVGHQAPRVVGHQGRKALGIFGGGSEDRPSNEERREVGNGGGHGIPSNGFGGGERGQKGNGQRNGGGFGTFGGGVPQEEIRRTMGELNEEIELPNGRGFEKLARAIGIPNGMGGMVGTPTHQPNGVGLPISGVVGEQMTIDDFARLVAKYVVAELADRLVK